MSTSTVPFPSESWLAAFHESLNASRAYALSAARWNHGPVAIVVTDDGRAPFAGLLDVAGGSCRGSFVVPLREARQAPTVLEAPRAVWLRLLSGEIGATYALFEGVITVSGRCRSLIRYMRAAQVMVSCAQEVATSLDRARSAA